MKQMSYIISVFFCVFLFSLFVTPKASADCVPFVEAPNLYEVDRVSSNSATLYFTPLNNSIQKYIIDYGLSVDDRRYSVHVNHGSSTGAVTYTISGLDPAFKYYYTVSAVNTCSQSPWSNWLSDAPTSTKSATLTNGIPKKTIAAPGSPAIIIGSLLTSALVFGGITFYRKSSN